MSSASVTPERSQTWSLIIRTRPEFIYYWNGFYTSPPETKNLNHLTQIQTKTWTPMPNPSYSLKLLVLHWFTCGFLNCPHNQQALKIEIYIWNTKHCQKNSKIYFWIILNLKKTIYKFKHTSAYFSIPSNSNLKHENMQTCFLGL